MNDIRIKSFFYGIQAQESREKEMNNFLARKNVEVLEIHQSSASVNSFDTLNILDVGVAITVVYRKIK
jgi:hypothetical protein